MVSLLPPMKLVQYTVMVTDKNLNVLGDPIADWITLDVTLKFNEPGAGLFTCPGYPWVVEQLNQPGARIVVNRYIGNAPSKILISGPVEKYLHERSDDGDNSGVGVLTVNFADDLALVVAHLAYPNPALAPEDQDIDNWTFSGNAEIGMRQLVNDNAGPGALTERRKGLEALVLDGVAGVGSTITTAADLMEPLGDVLRRMATSGGGLGFRTRQDAGQIKFGVYQPDDKSGEVRFGFGLGNMKYIAYERTAPTCTAAIVGGQGTGASSFTLERVDPAGQDAWGRMETLVSRDGSGATADLQADGDKQLADGAETVRVPSNVVDTPDQMYGVHYDLGTKVAIETSPGAQISDLVATVHLQAWPTAGEVVSATVGSQAAIADPLYIQQMRALEDRLARLERRVTPA